MHDGAETDAGAAYVFRRDEGGTDNWGQVAKLMPDTLSAGDAFGNAVALNDQYALVGAFYDDENGHWSGSAYLFEEDGSGDWIEIDRLFSDNIMAEDRFGYFVSLCGDIALLGSLNGSTGNVGAAYVFQLSTGTGLLRGDLNGDGFVGGDDLDIIRANWGQKVAIGDVVRGDISGDGFVGGDDLDLVRAHWGQGTPPASASVPEPSILVLLGGLLGLAVRRKGFHVYSRLWVS